jgi:hypothetical protein
MASLRAPATYSESELYQAGLGKTNLTVGFFELKISLSGSKEKAWKSKSLFSADIVDRKNFRKIPQSNLIASSVFVGVVNSDPMMTARAMVVSVDTVLIERRPSALVQIFNKPGPY